MAVPPRGLAIANILAGLPFISLSISKTVKVSEAHRKHVNLTVSKSPRVNSLLGSDTINKIQITLGKRHFLDVLYSSENKVRSSMA